MLQTKEITKKDLDENNFYKHSDSLEFEGNIEIKANLNYIKFKGKINAKGFIFAEAGWGIEAGEGIKAGEGIISGFLFSEKIIAKWISTNLRICAGFNEKEEQEIVAEIRKGNVILGKVVKPKIEVKQ